VNFQTFQTAVARQFDMMQKHQLFRTNVEKDALYATYLSSFPAGTDLIFRKRTEHDCSCCRQFIRAVGDVVAIIEGKIVSIWDIKVPSEPAYQAVADGLSAFAKSQPIGDVFYHYEKTAGTAKSFEDMLGSMHTWDHFFVNIQPKFVMRKDAIPSTINGPRTAKETFLRALKEIDIDSVDAILDLIAQNTLYRGQEQKFAVEGFGKMKRQFNKLKTDEEREIFAWNNALTLSGAITGIRGSAVGSLLQDLAKGDELDDAVKAFGHKMDPSNYKHPTALVSKAQIEKTKATIEELGLTSALRRRFASLNDITINNVMFADRSAKTIMSGDIFDELAAATPTKAKSSNTVEDVTIERFLADILPRAESIELLVENRHAGNMMSLIAPTDPTAGNLFKWPNNFSWAYAGEVADSIKERVKAAGGSVVGDLCCRLAWDYRDDLDFHMSEPGGDKISFMNKRRLSSNGGMLDLDANGGDGQRDNPAENIFYANRNKMKEGIYVLSVNNYSRRDDGKGFQIEIEFDGQIHSINYERALRTGEFVMVAKIKYSRASGFEIVESLPSSQTSKNVWGIPTQSFQKVNVMMMSPNHWDDKAVGNKHYFFMIDNCKNDGTPRGFFNEFLKEELTPHRKVLEIVGSKMKVAESDDQLSGLGFSSTQKNSIQCRVKGSFTRIINIVF
jgi:hypothetical protein